jgi:Zn-dependent peptidase ImmA (M78 family)/transcriptional regulator with XRE-family HTH domain
MRVGTSGFVGSRLREARTARGLSGVDLAGMLGVKPQMVSLYEAQKSTPSPQVMDMICACLGFQISYFMQESLPEDRSGIFWRSNSAATKTAQSRCETRLIWMKESISYFSEFFDFPQVTIPCLSRAENFKGLRNEQIEAAAAETRKIFGLGDGPIPDVVAELEEHGAMVARIVVGADSLDAFSQWSELDGRPYVVLGTDKASACRSRFDAAHELAHLVLHRGLDKKRINDTSDWALIEEQAHRFAAAFLFPSAAFFREVWAPSLDTFKSLKKRWKVSISFMGMRANHLGMMNEDQNKRFWINRNRRGWNKVEPLDDEIPFEEPNLLKKSVEMLVTENVRRKTQIISDLRLPESEVEEIANLPFGYFKEMADGATPSFKGGAKGRDLGVNDNVIPFEPRART